MCIFGHEKRGRSCYISGQEANSALSANKDQLRREVRARLKKLGEEAHADASDRIMSRVLVAPEFKRARTVLLYDSVPPEVETQALMQACLSLGKRLGLPRTGEDHSMCFLSVSDLQADLEPAAFKFMEPKAKLPLIHPETVDLIVVPGLAFDPDGNRLGRGAGFYDRYLDNPGLRATLCALAFECQILDNIPAQEHDRAVELIFTEVREIRAGEQ